MKNNPELQRKIQNVIIALALFIDEIIKMDQNISIGQGSNEEKGLYRKICREINNAKNTYGEYTLTFHFIPRIKHNDILEPEFDNTSILIQLNEFKTLLENTNFNNLESFEKLICGQQAKIIKLK